jgi:hypothetical protein
MEITRKKTHVNLEHPHVVHMMFFTCDGHTRITPHVILGLPHVNLEYPHVMCEESFHM